MTVSQVIVVEGKYDRARVMEAVCATVVEVGGFRIYRDKKMLEYLRSAAEKRGVIILTDSDAAGFKIRSFLKGALGGAHVSHAYIPAAAGKERRKPRPSAEGLLGVEATSGETIRHALVRAGATGGLPVGDLRKSDLYEAGLIGGPGSADMRRALAGSLGLPPRLSATALLDAINLSMSRDEFYRLVNIGFAGSGDHML